MHQKFMQRCIELAAKAKGNTYPNPLVGSVIVHNGKIIGEGYHTKAGENHAEINAILSVENPELLNSSTLYVSLEPCSHFGKTPPCALKIKEINFETVVIGTLDSHDKVNGKGIQILQNAGINMVTGVLEEECQELNKRFFTYHTKKRPYIILKWAESNDGLLDKDFKPTPISNELASQYVHLLRSEEHAILVGTQTALNDNPSLTTRLVEGRNLTRICIDFDLKVPKNYNIYNAEAPTLIFNSIKEGTEKNIQFIKVSRENFLNQLMQKLYENQIQSLLVEGGANTLQQFLNEDLWDEAMVIKNTNLSLGNGTKAPKMHLSPLETKLFRDNTIEFFRNSKK